MKSIRTKGIGCRAVGCWMLIAGMTGEGWGEDWAQFRGAGGQGRSAATGLPVTWSDTENVAWKVDLPGPGTSSPVVWKDRIYLTCQTGFGDGSGGELSDLKRHVLCFALKDGALIWNTAVPAEMPEQERIREDHGYASSTLAVDADRLYAFFGRAGVLAFDHAGKQLWKTNVGTGLNGWGSAASPVLYRDWVIVNASVESESVVALDKKSGREAWRTSGIKESWHTPVVAENAGKPELIMAMIQKVKGLDPATGKELWECETGIPWYMCPTPAVEGNMTYIIGGRGGNGLAIRLGGRGEVTDSHVAYKLNKGSNVSSAIYHHGFLFYANDSQGIAYCADAKTGAIRYEERFSPELEQIYASPILAEGRIYYLGRGGRVAVVAAIPEFKVLGTSTLENNRGMFNASPAVGGNRLLLRSNKMLYCLEAGAKD
ncbi:MAG: PQQ-binding-like beta-propeller repeat protein [Verrucomicrobiales bacterium]